MVSYICIRTIVFKCPISIKTLFYSPNTFTHTIYAPTNKTSVGVGTRKKAVLNIYSLGLFVSSPLEKQILKENPQGNALCKTIQSSNAQKAIELSFVMNLGPEKVSLTSILESHRMKTFCNFLTKTTLS